MTAKGDFQNLFRDCLLFLPTYMKGSRCQKHIILGMHGRNKINTLTNVYIVKMISLVKCEKIKHNVTVEILF